jgi:hypothetical protein
VQTKVQHLAGAVSTGHDAPTPHQPLTPQSTPAGMGRCRMEVHRPHIFRKAGDFQMYCKMYSIYSHTDKKAQILLNSSTKKYSCPQLVYKYFQNGVEINTGLGHVI